MFSFFKRPVLEESPDKLVNGELPFGWIAHNKHLVDDIQKEFSEELDKWIASRGKPNEPEILSDFISVLEKLDNKAKSRGECCYFYFINCITSPDYIEKRKANLNKLVTG